MTNQEVATLVGKTNNRILTYAKKYGVSKVKSGRTHKYMWSDMQVQRLQKELRSRGLKAVTLKIAAYKIPGMQFNKYASKKFTG